MKAKALLEGAIPGYSAATATALKHAFEQAWFMVAGRYTDAMAIERARLRLAECMLAVTNHNDTDVETMIRLALTMFRIEDADIAANTVTVRGRRTE
jgi:hypothetical protein